MRNAYFYKTHLQIFFTLFKKLFSTDHWQVTGRVEAPADDVFKWMLEIHKAEAKALLKLKAGEGALEKNNSHFFEVDTSAKTISVRGGFWYEGIFSVIEKGDHSQIVYRVNNIGPKSKIIPKLSKWLVPIWQYKTPAKMRSEMKDYLISIGAGLGCKTYLE